MDANFDHALTPGQRAWRGFVVFGLIFSLLLLGPGAQSAQDGLSLSGFWDTLGAPDPEEEEDLPPPQLSAPHARPLVLYSNTAVEEMIRYLLGRRDSMLSNGYRRSGRYLPLIRRILAEEGIPPELAYLVAVESNFQPLARSSMNAAGLWQLMVPTARRFGLKVLHPWYDERLDPEKSTRAAARLLGYLYDKFGTWDLALAAYNAGEGRLMNAMQRAQIHGVSMDYWSLPLPPQTQGFVPAFLAMTQIHSNPESFGLENIALDAPLEGEALVWNTPTTLEAVANRLGADYDELASLNPAWRLGLLPPNSRGPVVLRVPKGSADRLLDSLVLSPPPVIPWLVHTTAPGESFHRIAKEYGVQLQDLLALNGLQRRSRLQVNQPLLIPLPAETLAGPGGTRILVEDTLPTPTQSQDMPALTQLVLYTVLPDDSLWWISRRLGVTMAQIRHWNGLKNNRIAPGQTLALFPEQNRSEQRETGTPVAQR
ncbi:MAG: transglycosylase SLT domain-containing protein [Deltaproteobacteria bacterium]|nr:transglycosylase SLT domain-containing protein [Deltaproteobacteria bacterium]